jgi:hypothetical protein
MIFLNDSVCISAFLVLKITDVSLAISYNSKTTVFTTVQRSEYKINKHNTTHTWYEQMTELIKSSMYVQCYTVKPSAAGSLGWNMLRCKSVWVPDMLIMLQRVAVTTQRYWISNKKDRKLVTYILFTCLTLTCVAATVVPHEAMQAPQRTVKCWTVWRNCHQRCYWTKGIHLINL